MTLTGPSRPAASGQTDALVVFLHGYGADGNDLIGLADPLAPHLPNVAFVSPNAPQRCAASPMGYQWFPIPWLDGSREEEMQAGFSKAATTLDAWLTGTMAAHGVDETRTALVGFSQGTMMALHVGPRRLVELSGIVGFSGRFTPDATPPKSMPPVLLIHGDQDEVIPVAALSEAETALRARGHKVTSHISRGVPHGIGPDGLSLALEFLKRRLG